MTKHRRLIALLALPVLAAPLSFHLNSITLVAAAKQNLAMVLGGSSQPAPKPDAAGPVPLAYNYSPKNLSFGGLEMPVMRLDYIVLCQCKGGTVVLDPVTHRTYVYDEDSLFHGKKAAYLGMIRFPGDAPVLEDEGEDGVDR